MQVQIHTDSHIEGSDAMAQWASSTVKTALTHFSSQISRVEVHLSDENGARKNTDQSIQCTLEVRLEGYPPQVLKHQGANVNQALEGALDKMSRLLDSTLGKAARV